MRLEEIKSKVKFDLKSLPNPIPINVETFDLL